MTITDEQARLAAIRAEPADDVRRLDYADWLDEQPAEVECKGTGSVPSGFRERAEFIRLQIRLRRLSGRIEYDDERDAVRKRLNRIIDDSIGKWCGFGQNWTWSGDEIDTRVHTSDGVTYEVSRGFVHTVRCPLATWLAHGPAIVRSHVACVERVELTDAAPSRDAAVGSTRAAWLVAAGGDEDVLEMGYLPATIFDRLQDMTTSPTDAWNLGIAVYPTESDARDALSRACVEWAFPQAN